MHFHILFYVWNCPQECGLFAYLLPPNIEASNIISLTPSSLNDNIKIVMSHLFITHVHIIKVTIIARSYRNVEAYIRRVTVFINIYKQKLTKMLSDAISEHLFFKTFLMPL